MLERQTFQITDEQVETLKQSYFKKVAMENLIQNTTNGEFDKATPEVLAKYGEIADEYARVGLQIMVDEFGEEKANEVSEWRCEFDTKEFTVTF